MGTSKLSLQLNHCLEEAECCTNKNCNVEVKLTASKKQKNYASSIYLFEQSNVKSVQRDKYKLDLEVLLRSALSEQWLSYKLSLFITTS